LEYAGGTHFSDLVPASPEEAARWKSNRLEVYKGSMRHFLASLFRGTYSKEGFAIKLMPNTKGWPLFFGNKTTLFVKQKDIVFEGSTPYEKQLKFSGTLFVKYFGREINSDNHLVNETMSALHTSGIVLNYPSVTVNSRGVIKDWFPTKVYGYWAKGRIADALPLNFDPEE
jgi:hypothetical protein